MLHVGIRGLGRIVWEERIIEDFKLQTKLDKILAFLKSNKTKLFLSSKKGTNLISSGPKITGIWGFVNIYQSTSILFQS